MSRREEIIKKLEGSVHYMEQEYGVKSLCLFGSTARGDDNESSDVDILVDMPAKAFKLFSLTDFLKTLLGREVDVVRKHARLNDYFLNEIDRDGIIINATV